MADKFYLTLMRFGDTIYDAEKSEELQDMILETDWLEVPDQNLNQLK